MDVIYLDHNASSQLPEEILADLGRLYGESLGNPSSLHSVGRKSRRLINIATDTVADFVGCDPEFVYWTSGGSEANSWALRSAYEYARFKGIERPRFLISAIEHDSTLLAAQALAKVGAIELLTLPVTPAGLIEEQRLRELLEEDRRAGRAPLDLVSVLYASNETGVIQPVDRVGELCKNHGIPLHVDCVQALGKQKINLNNLYGTYFTFSGHKVGAPKGIGFLVVQGTGRLLWPLVHGKQQKQLRGGTENPLGAAILGRILKLAMTKESGIAPTALELWRRDFEAELKRRIPGTRIHGEDAPRLPNTSFVGFEGVDGDGILLNLDLERICASSGSACTSGSLDPSTVLLAMGCDKAMARSSVRFSSGYGTTWSDFERVLEVLPPIVGRIRMATKNG